MKFLYIAAEKARYPVSLLCRALRVSRSGFYAWTARHERAHDQKDAKLTGEIKTVYEKHQKRYGSPRIHRELRRKGIRVARKRVARLMKAEGMAARKRRRFKTTTDSRHEHPIAPNLLQGVSEVKVPRSVMVGAENANRFETPRARIL